MDSQDNYFAKMIMRILDDGIYLGQISSSSEYLEDIADFFNQDPNLFCKFDYKTLIVEDAMCMPVLNLMIRNNTLYILPAAQDNFFTCFMKLVSYISQPKKKKKNAKKEIDENEFEWI